MHRQNEPSQDDASRQAQDLIDEALTELAEQTVQKKSRFGFWVGLTLILGVIVFAVGWWVVRPIFFPYSNQADIIIDARPIKFDDSQIRHLSEGGLKASKKVINFQYSFGNIRATVPRIVEFYVSQQIPEARFSDITAIADKTNSFVFYASFNYRSAASAPPKAESDPLQDLTQFDINLQNLQPKLEGSYSFQWRVNILSEAIGEEALITAYNDDAKSAFEYYQSAVSKLLGLP